MGFFSFRPLSKLCRAQMSPSGALVVYLIFEDIEKARRFVEDLNKRDDTIEVVVYDSRYELVECHDAPKWKAASNSEGKNKSF